MIQKYVRHIAYETPKNIQIRALTNARLSVEKMSNLLQQKENEFRLHLIYTSAKIYTPVFPCLFSPELSLNKASRQIYMAPS